MTTRFGVCTWTLGLSDPAQLLAKVRQLGLTTAQFHGDHRTHDPLVVRAAAQATGISLYAIDPIQCGPKPGERRDAAHGVAYYRGVIDFAADAGSDTVTVHGLGQWCADEDNRDDAFDRLVAALHALCDHATSRGIRLLWEMCNRYEVPMVRTCAEGRELSRRVARTGFALILDSFHMNIEERDAVAEIHATGADLAVYHVSDSDRGGIGSGHVDFRAQHRALRQIGYASPVMFEVVLPELCPHTPPQTADHWQRLTRAIEGSIAAWHGYDDDLAPLRRD